MTDIWFNESQLETGLAEALGYSIEDPFPVELGGFDDDGNRVLQPAQTDTDNVNVYYFHELEGMNEFRGEAVNSGSSPLNIKNIKWGTAVYIRHDPVMKTWVLAGIVPRLADQFIEDTDQNEPRPIQLNQFVPGLLDQTDPPSMQARVMSGPYSVGDELYVPATQLTADFSASPTDTLGAAITIPTTPGQAKLILVQIKAETGVLSYKQGAEFPANISFQVLYTADANGGTYFPKKDAGRFRSGYVKLINGMTNIRRTVNLWAVHEVLTQSSAGEIVNRIMTDDDGNVMVDDDGNVMLEDIE